jgi:pimeloyl-ACP methyl ester carboxylesterase
MKENFVKINLVSDSGQGRAFVLIHEQGSYVGLAEQAAKQMSGKARVLVFQSSPVSENFNFASPSPLISILGDLGLRQCSIIGFGDSGVLAQHLVLTQPKLVRSLVLVDGSFRSHPSRFTKIVDWLESHLPLGLPLRLQERGFDSKPFAQRIRCPVLLALTPLVNDFIRLQSQEILYRIPSAWMVELKESNMVEHFCDLIDTFERVPVKCPQKNIERAT